MSAHEKVKATDRASIDTEGAAVDVRAFTAL